MYGYTFCRYILLHHPILSESVNNVPVRCSAVYALRAAESIHMVIVTCNITDNVLTHPPPSLQFGKNTIQIAIHRRLAAPLGHSIVVLGLTRDPTRAVEHGQVSRWIKLFMKIS